MQVHPWTGKKLAINKMVKRLYYSLYLPVTVLAALCTDKRISFKFVCVGNSVDVFQNITSTFFKSDYTLYKIFGNENNPETIAAWTIQNFSTKAIILPKYDQKVLLENGSIMLQDFQASDEATYRMLHQNYSRNKEIQLCALVPPTLRCKPNIKHEDNFLIASLDNHEYCGRPLVSVRWLEYPGVTYITKSRIELPPGNEAGTYRACFEGETIKCLKNSSEREICENYTIGSRREDANPTISDIPQLTKTTYVIVAIVSMILFGVFAILIKLFWKQNKPVPNVDREQTTGPSSTRTDDRADDAPVPDNTDREPTAQAIEIEMQPMLSANH